MLLELIRYIFGPRTHCTNSPKRRLWKTLPRQLPFTSSRLNPAFLETAEAPTPAVSSIRLKISGTLSPFQRERTKTVPKNVKLRPEKNKTKKECKYCVLLRVLTYKAQLSLSITSCLGGICGVYCGIKRRIYKAKKCLLVCFALLSSRGCCGDRFIVCC